MFRVHQLSFSRVTCNTSDQQMILGLGDRRGPCPGGERGEGGREGCLIVGSAIDTTGLRSLGGSKGAPSSRREEFAAQQRDTWASQTGHKFVYVAWSLCSRRPLPVIVLSLWRGPDVLCPRWSWRQLIWIRLFYSVVDCRLSTIRYSQLAAEIREQFICASPPRGI